MPNKLTCLIKKKMHMRVITQHGREWCSDKFQDGSGKKSYALFPLFHKLNSYGPKFQIKNIFRNDMEIIRGLSKGRIGKEKLLIYSFPFVIGSS